MTKQLNTLFNIYNKLYKAANMQVKYHNPNINLCKYTLTKNNSNKEILNKINQLIPYIQNPENAHIYIKHIDKP